jgi:hypothetical protein
LQPEPYPLIQVRLMRMRADHKQPPFVSLKQDPYWQETAAVIAGLETAPELDLDDEIHT